MDSLVVNDMCNCKRPVTKFTRHFVYGGIIQRHTVLESNCKVIKLPRNGNLGRNKMNKIQFSLQKLSCATKRLKSLDIFCTNHPFVD